MHDENDDPDEPMPEPETRAVTMWKTDVYAVLVLILLDSLLQSFRLSANGVKSSSHGPIFLTPLVSVLWRVSECLWQCFPPVAVVH